MNTTKSLLCSLLPSLLCCSAFAQTTAFTYQGRLNDGAAPANGSYDLRFILHGDAVLPGFQAGLPRTNSAVTVSNGLFTTVVDFGPAWDNQPRWLELAVRPAGSTNDFATLAPRQAVNVVPKADYANRAAALTSPLPEYWLPTSAVRDYVNETITGLYHFSPLPGNPPFTVSSPVVVPNLNADKLDGLEATDFWKLGGNAGTTAGSQFLGTTDQQPLEIGVYGQRGLRFEPSASLGLLNIIGGSLSNQVINGARGATIAGGGNAWPGDQNVIGGDLGFIGGGRGNTVTVAESVVTGGRNNTASAFNATVGGGFGNTASGNYATVSGGYLNTASGVSATALGQGTMASGDSSIAMGYEATASGDYSFAMGAYATASGGASVAMGAHTTASGDWSTATGSETTASGSGSTAMGYLSTASGLTSVAMGFTSKASHNNTFVWSDGTIPLFGSSSINQFLVNAGGGVGINTTNPAGYALAVNGPAYATKMELAPGSAASPAYAFSGDFNTGLYRPSAAAVALATAGTERLRVNATGVGIGITIPAANLHVNGTTIIQGNNNWGVTGGEGDFRVGNDSYRFKIGVANAGGGAGDVWMRAHGGIQRINVKAPGGIRMLSDEAESAGVSLAAGGTAWAVISDRNVKKDFAVINPVDILEKLSSMPITQWRYNWENAESTPHIGPMAQDFKAAFYPGSDDKHITTQEADGVALAAIQGLNQKLERENAELKFELNELKKVVEAMNQKLNGGVK